MNAARHVVKARNALSAALVSGDAKGNLTEALVLLDAWLYAQDEKTKRALEAYFGRDELPVNARLESSPATTRDESKQHSIQEE